MSKASLQKTLSQVITRLENSKKEIREALADKMEQRIRISAKDLEFQIFEFIKDKRLEASNPAAIKAAVVDFCNDVYMFFQTKKGYEVEKVGTPLDFTLILRQAGASGSVFKLALRQQLNPYLEQLERVTAQAAGGSERDFVRGIANPSGQSVSKGFLNLGHTDSSSIAAVGPKIAMTPSERKVVMKSEYTELVTKLTKLSLFDSKEFMEIELERSSSNMATASKGEAGQLKNIAKELRTIIEDLDISNIQGSPSMREEFIDALISTAKGKKPKKHKASTAKNVKKIKTTVNQSKLSLNLTSESAGVSNWLSLIGIINSRLPQTVIGNMGSPALNNRTGTFANSTRVTGVIATPQGYPSFSYTYDKAPYGVFDPRTGAAPWATPERDPNKLIEKSIREIAASLAIGRFYLRRS